MEFCDLARKLSTSEHKLRDCLDNLQSLGLIIQGENSVVFNDLKERTVLANYRPIQSSDPDKCLSSITNKKRNKVIKSINNTFFGGIMSPSWYTDIDSLFENFKFESDTMYMLFQECSRRHKLYRGYVLQVAQSWYKKGVVTSLDAEECLENYSMVKNIGRKIKKKLNRQNPFSEYDEELIYKWLFQYKYNFDIIDIALQKTTGTSNPNLNYINSILTNWYNAKLKTKDDILSYDNSMRQKHAKNKSKKVPNDSFVAYKDFEQREYSDSDFESFYHHFDDESSN